MLNEMNVYAIVTVVVTFTALSGWVNARFLNCPVASV